jgi:membrane protein implicated in regulation of membrane protease activity
MRAGGSPEPGGQLSGHWLAALAGAPEPCVHRRGEILAVFAGLKSVAMFAMGLGTAAVTLAAAFFCLPGGVLRWLSLAVFAAAPIAVIVSAFADLLWVAIASAAAASTAAGRTPARRRRPSRRHGKHVELGLIVRVAGDVGGE